jgi:hypothetical protein
VQGQDTALRRSNRVGGVSRARRITSEISTRGCCIGGRGSTRSGCHVTSAQVQRTTNQCVESE